VSINRWAEYNAGTLTAPAIVQQDQVGSEYLIWVWTGTQIEGPLSRSSFDETAFMAAFEALLDERAAAEAERLAQAEFDELVGS
jgi:hypothetical protein